MREVDVHGEDANILRPLMMVVGVSIGGHMVVVWLRHVAWWRRSLVLSHLPVSHWLCSPVWSQPGSSSTLPQARRYLLG